MVLLGGPALCALAAGLAGLIFGLPSLKIKGFYLIMATIAAHFIIIWLILQLRSITGGADGLAVPKPRIGGLVLNSKASYFYLVMVFACLATFLAMNIVRTRAGRAFVAIRDNDLAAEVMGINLWSYKLQAFFIGCVYAGVAGALLVHYYGFASVDQFPFHGFGLVSGHADRRGHGQHTRGHPGRRFAQAAG